MSLVTVKPLLATRFKLSFDRKGRCTTFRKDQAEALFGEWVWLVEATNGMNDPLYTATAVPAPQMRGLKHPEYAHGISDVELIKEALAFCDEELDAYEGMEYDDDCEVCCQRSNTFIRELVRRFEMANLAVAYSQAEYDEAPRTGSDQPDDAPPPAPRAVGSDDKVMGLEEQVLFTLSDASRLLRKQDVQGACPHPDDCFYETDRVRCGPCAVKASAAKGVIVDDTHSHLPEVCRLRRELRAATARIAELEAATQKASQAENADLRAQILEARTRAIDEAAATHVARVIQIRNDAKSYKNGKMLRSAKRASDFHERAARAISLLANTGGQQ